MGPLAVAGVQALAGAGLAFLPLYEDLQLDPGRYFVALLPPLLFADGWMMPLRETARAKRSILMLALGLVAFTTVLVAVAAKWMAPEMPWAMAFALGAVVSPTAAVTVSAIASKLKVPYRLSTVQNGESLGHDFARGLVPLDFEDDEVGLEVGSEQVTCSVQRAAARRPVRGRLAMG